jgi:hypothetical protein
MGQALAVSSGSLLNNGILVAKDAAAVFGGKDKAGCRTASGAWTLCELQHLVKRCGQAKPPRHPASATIPREGCRHLSGK